ncbi:MULTISPECIES: MBL fold metallo-hydrolase [unclassified Granulicatella]|uniref:MBL fold metallo-hydrolase n=1 Tax=unclassified Granulicatella TaxID=2630493 RepID=UPI0010735211|nr:MULTISPECIES: MBL fold metallo-hydrolase [unclassified Granulicatella]MBF0779989.1 MBL fold metallo-hydrolase [Granulicatella sp. 19428wC4_WM01]TFU95915.1 MBL fold metallo-hydrolase [Granulicatella sp. WM01]
MKLTILGCQGAYPANSQATTSYLLESDNYFLLIDFGSGAFQNLAKIMEPTDIHALILTHYHHDHIADVGVLQYAFQLKSSLENKSKKEFVIYGHNHSDEFNRLVMPTVNQVEAYNPDEILRVGPFKITFLKTIHPVVCYALRIEDKHTKKSIVFTADSGYLADFITFARQTDLLLADAMFLNGKENQSTHMSAQEVGKIADLAQVKRVVLTHLPPLYQDLLLEQAKEVIPDNIPVTLAKDFDEYII